MKTDTDMTDNLDELKRQWQQMAVNMAGLEQANRRLSERLASGRITSLQDKFVHRIKRNAILSLLLPVMAPLTNYIGLPAWYGVLYAISGVVMAIISFSLSQYASAERLTDMPVANAVRRAIRIRTAHIRILMFTIPLACLLIMAFVFNLPPGEDRFYMMIGCAVGTVIGAAIGAWRCVSEVRLARRIVETLEEKPDEE